MLLVEEKYVRISERISHSKPEKNPGYLNLMAEKGDFDKIIQYYSLYFKLSFFAL